MFHYYIYYRIDLASLQRVTRIVAGILDAVERQTGVCGRWMRRLDDPTTCMEVYEGVADRASFEAALATLAADLAMLGCDRHVECFVDASIEPAAGA